jgi:hypothetical protein
MHRHSKHFIVPGAKALALSFCLAAAFGPATTEAAAAGPFDRFVGSWTGSGHVIGTKGDRERIRCRASYWEAESGSVLNQSIVCASDSYRIEITSYVQASGSEVQGSWKEHAQNASGQLTGQIQGGRFDGSVLGPGFSAAISLTSDGRRQAVSIRPQGGDINDVQIELERRG